jgi:hypothetical protein
VTPTFLSYTNGGARSRRLLSLLYFLASPPDTVLGKAMPNDETSMSANFDDLNTTLQTLALKSTRNAAALPTDLAFHRTLDRDFGRDMDACSAKIMSLANDLLAFIDSGDASRSGGRKGKERRVEGQDDVVDDFRGIVVDAIDRLLERTVRRYEGVAGAVVGD